MDEGYMRVYALMIVQFILDYSFLALNAYVPSVKHWAPVLLIASEALATVVTILSFRLGLTTLKKLALLDFSLSTFLIPLGFLYGEQSALINSILTLVVIALAFSVGFFYALNKVFT